MTAATVSNYCWAPDLMLGNSHRPLRWYGPHPVHMQGEEAQREGDLPGITQRRENPAASGRVSRAVSSACGRSLGMFARLNRNAFQGEVAMEGLRASRRRALRGQGEWLAFWGLWLG